MTIRECSLEGLDLELGEGMGGEEEHSAFVARACLEQVCGADCAESMAGEYLQVTWLKVAPLSPKFSHRVGLGSRSLFYI